MNFAKTFDRCHGYCFFYIVTAVGFFQTQYPQCFVGDICWSFIRDSEKMGCSKWIQSQPEIQVFFNQVPIFFKRFNPWPKQRRFNLLWKPEDFLNDGLSPVSFVCYIKAIPAIFVILFIWPHARPLAFEGRTFADDTFLCYTYFAGWSTWKAIAFWHSYGTSSSKMELGRRPFILSVIKKLLSSPPCWKNHCRKHCCLGAYSSIPASLPLIQVPYLTRWTRNPLSWTIFCWSDDSLVLEISICCQWTYERRIFKIFSALQKLQKKTLDQGIALDTSDF